MRAALALLGLALAPAALLAPAAAHALMISEVMYNPTGPDNGNEWVELYNDGTSAIDLANYSLGWGGADYTYGTLDLDPLGVLASGAYIVVGQTIPLDFNPDLQNGYFVADGVALFDVSAASITPTTTPIDAVIYGTFFATNSNNLIDQTGSVGTVDVVTGGAGQSIVQDASGSWTASATPTPGTGTLPAPVPEPSTGVLVGLGLAGLAWRARGRRLRVA